MQKSDKASIHEAMEQQCCSIAKAGIVSKLNSRCSIIAGMNPKNLKVGKDCDIGLSGALLSRFDLVFVLEDQCDLQWKLEIADHILNEMSLEPKVDSDLWSIEKLRYHFIVSQNTEVKINDQAYDVLSKYYLTYRSSSLRDPSRTTVRMLDSLIRLSKAHAKLLLRDEANIFDVVTVIRLMEASY
jgi:DNA helicase MCM9